MTEEQKKEQQRKKLEQMKKQQEEKDKKAAKKEKAVDSLAQNEDLVEVDETRSPASLVFIGHVDAGKSTIGGQLMYSFFNKQILLLKHF